MSRPTARRTRGALNRREFLMATGATAVAVACAPGTQGTPAVGGGPAAAVTPRRGGTLVIAGTSDTLGLDPAGITDFSSLQTAYLVFEGLVRYTPTREIEASLAESWQVSDRVWTFKLRKSVLFHDGTPFNSAAVKAHFDRMFADKLFPAPNYTPYIDKIEAVDDLTLRITTKNPDAFLLDRLAQVSAFFASPAAVAKYGKDIVKNAVGTGPFKFSEWIKDDRFVVTRNDAYWGGAPYLDSVIVRPVPSPEARTIGIEAGDIHMALDITPEARARLLKNERVNVLETPGGLNTFLGMNVLKKPFDDLRVRQALNYAIDKESIVKNLYAGAAVELPGHVSLGTPGYAKTTGFAYDPAKAKKLLADAGYPNGFSTTLLSSDNYAKDLELVTFLQQQLKAVGVTAKIEQLEWAKYLDLLRKDPRTSPVEMWRDGRSGSDAAAGTLRTYGCDFFRPTGGNTNGYCNKDIDKLLEEGARTVDATKRDAVLKQAQQLIAEAAPSVWLIAPNQVWASAKKVRDPLLIRGWLFTPTAKTWMEP